MSIQKKKVSLWSRSSVKNKPAHPSACISFFVLLTPVRTANILLNRCVYLKKIRLRGINHFDILF